MAYQTVGKPMPRIEGADKVTGATRYAADLPIPESLYAKVLRSPLAHARIRKIDTAAAKALPGVHAVLTGADLPEVYVGLRMKDMPVLATDKVRFVGDPGSRGGRGHPRDRRRGAAPHRGGLRGVARRVRSAGGGKDRHRGAARRAAGLQERPAAGGGRGPRPAQRPVPQRLGKRRHRGGLQERRPGVPEHLCHTTGPPRLPGAPCLHRGGGCFR